jgi:hypothetical protein
VVRSREIHIRNYLGSYDVICGLCCRLGTPLLYHPEEIRAS